MEQKTAQDYYSYTALYSSGLESKHRIIRTTQFFFTTEFVFFKSIGLIVYKSLITDERLYKLLLFFNDLQYTTQCPCTRHSRMF